jgi:hypothetical protein
MTERSPIFPKSSIGYYEINVAKKNTKHVIGNKSSSVEISIFRLYEALII